MLKRGCQWVLAVLGFKDRRQIYPRCQIKNQYIILLTCQSHICGMQQQQQRQHVGATHSDKNAMQTLLELQWRAGSW